LKLELERREMESPKSQDVFEQLEQRISRAMDVMSAMRAEREALRRDNTILQSEIEVLKQSSIELLSQLNDLQIQQLQRASSFDKEEVRKKIDHVLEKFGELQL